MRLLLIPLLVMVAVIVATVLISTAPRSGTITESGVATVVPVR
jgi:hypothetical protein